MNDMLSQMYNQFLPFGGVGDSGHGRLHGKEGFDSCSNIKSVMRKHPLKFYPFSAVFPPYSKEKKRMIRLFVDRFDFTQAQLIKRSLIVLMCAFVAWLVITKRVTIAKARKLWNVIKMMV